MKKTTWFHSFLGKIGLVDSIATAKPEDFGFAPYYKAPEAEIRWAVRKCREQRRRYEALLKLKGNGQLDSWEEFAALHYIAFRLNFSQLSKLVPAPLNRYESNYYYEAGMEILNRLKEGK